MTRNKRLEKKSLKEPNFILGCGAISKLRRTELCAFLDAHSKSEPFNSDLVDLLRGILHWEPDLWFGVTAALAHYCWRDSLKTSGGRLVDHGLKEYRHRYGL